MTEFGDASRTREHLCLCHMLVGCCCDRVNRRQEMGWKPGTGDSWVPLAQGPPVLLCMELLTQMCHDELMSPQCTWGDVSIMGELGTIPRAAGQRSQAPCGAVPRNCDFIAANTHQRWEKGSRCRKSRDHSMARSGSGSCVAPGWHLQASSGHPLPGRLKELGI